MKRLEEIKEQPKVNTLTFDGDLTFGEVIRLFRESRNLNASELSMGIQKRFGVSLSACSIETVENGISSFRFARIFLIADFMGVSINHLRFNLLKSMTTKKTARGNTKEYLWARSGDLMYLEDALEKHLKKYPNSPSKHQLALLPPINTPKIENTPDVLIINGQKYVREALNNN